MKKFFDNFKSSNTVRPLKVHKKKKSLELSQYVQETFCQASLGTGTMKGAVVLPKGEELNEWLAVNTVDFFNEISLLYGSIAEYCTSQTCPVMNAGDKKYAWKDGVKILKPIECCAPDYVDYLMEWTESQLNDESIFPLQAGAKFPKNFHEIIKTIFKRLFRIYAHIYHAHFEKILTLNAEAHLNTCFKHFLYFVLEFKLVNKKDMSPLKPLIEKWTKKDKKYTEKKSSRRQSRESKS
mmetsp:Transcript_31683/g.77257  ORF Transcript_31683/g.77257 Transcript_31683/m.77257 type:complete len:238 (+) Transcript_31683:109-822(+)|eukprot:CAMPEP_0114516418 /NCGR_PEP_ID=MMETSP0109-20121206/17314_1 /TAXON_ID=29199 /ORGANISM="Chlorarachnion reptans, Strain CCCM449" /LENGTH=237 /DNA_ID=CAMNT_0001696799 /DNA_START=53 /DNA_END=766 /DNA_ORIENTATION=-